VFDKTQQYIPKYFSHIVKAGKENALCDGKISQPTNILPS
jgi:hypothetical protein